MNDKRPSWLTEECPPWCVSDHAEDDHPHDRVHQGAIATVPVVLREQTLEEGRVVSIEHAAEFDVVRFRPVGAMEWLFIGDDEHGLEVSAESAARLAACLASACVERVDGR